MSASRAIRGLLLRKNGVKNLVLCNRNSSELRNLGQAQRLSSIACINKFSLGNEITTKKRHLCISECDFGGIRKRGLLGCGDGAEANVLAKVYEEKRVLGSVFSGFMDFLFCNFCCLWFSIFVWWHLKLFVGLIVALFSYSVLCLYNLGC